jgi:hypothetical protein
VQQDLWAVGTTGIGLFSSNFTKTAVEQSMYYKTIDLKNQEQLRHIALPIDPSFYDFYAINESHYGPTGVNSNADSFWFIGYVQGATYSGASVIIDIYANYELEPAFESVLENLAEKCSERGNPMTQIEKLAPYDLLVTQSAADVSSVAAKIDEDLSTTGSILKVGKDVVNFVSHHAEALSFLGKTALSMI